MWYQWVKIIKRRWEIELESLGARASVMKFDMILPNLVLHRSIFTCAIVDKALVYWRVYRGFCMNG